MASKNFLMTSQADRASGLQVAVLGATGRMGREIIRILSETARYTLMGGASAGDKHPRLGRPLNRNVKLASSEDALSDAHVAIDFSLPEAMKKHLEICLAKRVPYVCGVTGLTDDDKKALEDASQIDCGFMGAEHEHWRYLVLYCGREYRCRTGRRFRCLDSGYSPCRQARHPVRYGAGVWSGRSRRAGAPRKITFDSIREGEYPGEHQIRFNQGEELIELRHRAGSRREFAVGAVRAASGSGTSLRVCITCGTYWVSRLPHRHPRSIWRIIKSQREGLSKPLPLCVSNTQRHYLSAAGDSVTVPAILSP